jgi:branched-chain amino acid transport system permease protein
VGSLPGAILGAAVVVGLPEYLRAIGDYRMLVFGAILIATMLFGEGGLAALCAATGRRLRGWLVRIVPKLAPSDEGAR